MEVGHGCWLARSFQWVFCMRFTGILGPDDVSLL